MIIVAGYLKVAAEERERYLAAVQDVEVEARRARGCLDFAQTADRTDASRIIVYERWESDEDLLAFRSQATDSDVDVVLPEIIEASVSKYRISSVEAP